MLVTEPAILAALLAADTAEAEAALFFCPTSLGTAVVGAFFPCHDLSIHDVRIMSSIW